MKKSRNLAIRMTAVQGMLIAVSIICGKYLAIRGGDVLRFSFENLPIIFAGITFGPIAAALVAIIADLLGCVLVGYTVNLVVTLGAAALGIVSGVLWSLVKKWNVPTILKVMITVMGAHLIGSVIIKTVGLAAFYAMPLWMLMLWRLLNYAIVGALEGILLCVLVRNKALSAAIRGFKKGEDEKL